MGGKASIEIKELKLVTEDIEVLGHDETLQKSNQCDRDT